MFGLDGHSGSSPRNSTRTSRPERFEGLEKTFEGRLGIGAFVVDIDHQDQVDLCVGKLGVSLGRANRFDVGDAGLAGVVSEHLQHLRLEVGGQDVPLGPTRWARRMLW